MPYVMKFDKNGVQSIRMVSDSAEEEREEIKLMPIVQQAARELTARIQEYHKQHNHE